MIARSCAVGARLFVVRFGAEPPEYGALLRYLSPRRRERIEASRDNETLMRNIAAELSVCHALRRFGLAYAPADYSYSAAGMPEAHGLFLSISHSARVAVCAAAHVPIGVDIERIRRVSGALAKRLGCSGECGDEALLSHWVARESFLKMTGEGLSGLSRVRYSPETGEIRSVADCGGSGRIRIMPFPPCAGETSGYIAAVCTASPSEVSITEYPSAAIALEQL